MPEPTELEVLQEISGKLDTLATKLDAVTSRMPDSVPVPTREDKTRTLPVMVAIWELLNRRIR